jgi:hypothetical protein
MPVMIYQRSDFAIRLFADGSEAVLTIDSPEGRKLEMRVPRTLIESASTIPKQVSDAVRTSISAGQAVSQPWTLTRVTVEVGVRDWAVLEWESLEVGDRLVVRTSPVRPRVLQIPITLPIRVLEVDGTPVVSAAIDVTFQGTARGNAYINAHTTLFDVESFARRESWATVAVLHVHDLPGGTSLLTNAHDSAAGTTGWFLRFSDRFQTRLIVLDGHQSVPPVHRRLAQTIIDRGGPAVLLLSNNSLASHTLYGEISHDRPLDWIHAKIAGSELFSGAGGEEALRYSVVARELTQPRVASWVKKAYVTHLISPQIMRRRPSIDLAALRYAIVESATDMQVISPDATGVRFKDLWGTRAQRLGHSLAAKLPRHGLVAIDLGSTFEDLRRKENVISVDDLAGHIVRASRPFQSMSRRSAANIFSTKLDDIVRSSAAYHYEDHESDGMLPLAAKIADARSLVNAVRDPKAKPRRVLRHVNSAFYTTGSDGKLKKIPQRNARLRVGEVAHLGVRIGPKDELIVTLGPTNFIEEKVRWDGDGAWMEIGVTGIDFDVIGDPVQEFYLPREESSDLITFAVRSFKPTAVPGVARLRFTIYHRDNVLQSFFVAAALEDAPRNVASLMARALSVPVSDAKNIGTCGYIARLEYSTTANIADCAHASPRGLTILANDSAGDMVTTIKGDDLFRVGKNTVSAQIVDAARTALEKASLRGAAYRYQSYENTENATDPRELCEVLPDIAYAGWRIYDALVPDSGDQERIRSLIEKGNGIHAAHLDLSNVIPWSMVYDRVVFFDRKTAPPSVCRASMPDAKGNLLAVECEAAGCLLNKADNDELRRNGEPVYTEETVICPRRFWGFMFPIDVPAQKVDGIDGKSRGLAEEIKAGDPVNVVAGYNDKRLDFGGEHVADLEQGILKKAKVRSGTGRVPVRTLMTNNDPDIVYFYCHALAKFVANGKDLGSTLDFGLGSEGVIDDVLFPADFGGKPVWTHSPLVFMNGCSTVGFNPYAPSEFIKQFIQAKHAAAVVGTETTIVEMLAMEVAKSFLEELLKGQSAGNALLRMRRLLLAKNNPLGLMYTLYGSSGLKLVTASAAGKT